MGYRPSARQNAQLPTTDYAIDETITRLRYAVSTAVRFLNFMERAQETDVLAVVEIDGAMFQEAKRLFRQCDSAKLSFGLSKA